MCALRLTASPAPARLLSPRKWSQEGDLSDVLATVLLPPAKAFVALGAGASLQHSAVSMDVLVPKQGWEGSARALREGVPQLPHSWGAQALQNRRLWDGRGPRLQPDLQLAQLCGSSARPGAHGEEATAGRKEAPAELLRWGLPGPGCGLQV